MLRLGVRSPSAPMAYVTSASCKNRYSSILPCVLERGTEGRERCYALMLREPVMATVTIEEAQARLAELIDKLSPGDELFITRDGHTVAKVIVQRKSARWPPRLGTLRGTVLYMAPDFDAPLEEFKDHME